MLALDPGVACGLALLAHQATTPPAVPGYPSLADAQPPSTIQSAAQRAGSWAESQSWFLADPSFSRLPGLWYPPTAAPSDSLSPLPFDPTEAVELASFVVSEPYLHVQLVH